MARHFGSEARLQLNSEDEAHVRAARAQSLSREANERIRALPNRPPAVFDLFVCECRLDGCTATVSLTEDEYSAIRRHPSRFVVVPGHRDAGVERVVDAAPGRFEIVDTIVGARTAVDEVGLPR